MNKLSVVIPVYKASSTLGELVSRIVSSVEPLDIGLEIILVDDGCPENSWNEILNLSLIYPQIKGFKLSKNFGQHPAIDAGLDQVTGTYVVVMDCDLQDLPEEIPSLILALTDEIDAVVALRADRSDSFYKKMTSYTFGRVCQILCHRNFVPASGNFGVYKSWFIDNIRKVNIVGSTFGINRLIIGGNVKYIPVRHGQRMVGDSSYNIAMLFDLGLTLITLNSKTFLYFFVKLGLLIVASTMVFILFTLFNYLTTSTVSGWTSTILIVSFSLGVNVTLMGVLGLYLFNVLAQVKKTPQYIISRKT